MSNSARQVFISSRCLLKSTTYNYTSIRCILFWYGNWKRELYRTPEDALRTDELRKKRKSFSAIIREGLLGPMIKQIIWPELKTQLKQIRPLSFRPAFNHNDYVYIHNFADNEEIKKWTVRTDLDEKVGKSTAEILPSGHGSLLFRGNISTEIINHETLYNKSGFAIMASERLQGYLFMPKLRQQWKNFSHFLIRLRGDGRTYELRAHTPGLDNTKWSYMHSMILYTRGGPYWQTAKIPFSKLFRNNMGRVVDVQTKFNPYLCTQLSIAVADYVDGPFELEISHISLLRDEKYAYDDFAYESYQAPPFTTMAQ